MLREKKRNGNFLMFHSTTGPSGLGGRLWPLLWALPGGWPLSRPPAGLLSWCGRSALRAADLAGCWTRVWFAGSWPDSHSGGGTGFGAGGGVGCAAFAAGEGLALTGITDSSLALLVAGSCV